jgi:F-type H+-transporting ATPase subunit gamma
MASLKSIKLKISSYKKTGSVTRAMEAVSAVKMRKGQERALSSRAYAAAGLSILERLSGTIDTNRHPLMQPLKGKTVFIVVTSDKGLAGSLNSGVIRAVEQKIGSLELPKDEVVIAPIGRRARDYFTSRNYKVWPVLASDVNIADDVSEVDAMNLTNVVRTWRRVGHGKFRDIGDVFVAYQNFISTFEQQPTVHKILPITPESIRYFVRGIRPARGRYSREPESVQGTPPAAYTIEPDADTVLAELLPKLLNIAIFHALLESKASEHSARMVAMKSATDKAKEMAQNLTRTFNKVRQAAITREVSEITSGIEAMR